MAKRPGGQASQMTLAAPPTNEALRRCAILPKGHFLFPFSVGTGVGKACAAFPGGGGGAGAGGGAGGGGGGNGSGVGSISCGLQGFASRSSAAADRVSRTIFGCDAAILRVATGTSACIWCLLGSEMLYASRAPDFLTRTRLSFPIWCPWQLSAPA